MRVNHYTNRDRMKHCRCCAKVQKLNKVRTNTGDLIYLCDTCRSQRIAAINVAHIARGKP